MAFKIERKKPEIEGAVTQNLKNRGWNHPMGWRETHLNNIYITFNGQVFPRGVGFFF